MVSSDKSNVISGLDSFSTVEALRFSFQRQDVLLSSPARNENRYTMRNLASVVIKALLHEQQPKQATADPLEQHRCGCTTIAAIMAEHQ